MGVAVMSVIAQQQSKGGLDIAGCLTVGVFAVIFGAVGAVVGHVIAWVTGA
jgi:hypothetical protein